jgi:hypothetical protein
VPRKTIQVFVIADRGVAAPAGTAAYYIGKLRMAVGRSRLLATRSLEVLVGL